MGKDDRQAVAADRPRGRRQEYAEANRQAIASAARRLFADQGYFSTRVEDIATEARVAPATVYSVSGGIFSVAAYDRGYYPKVYQALRRWIDRDFPFTRAWYSNAVIPDLPG